MTRSLPSVLRFDFANPLLRPWDLVMGSNAIVVIEDQAIVRGLVVRAAQDALPDAVVHPARSGAEGLELCRREQPGIVLLDLELPDVDGFELVTTIRAASSRTRIIIFSSHTEDYLLHRVNQAHVEGFVDKNEQTPEMLIDALRTVAADRRYFSPTIERALAQLRSDPRAFPKVLSEREQELLRLLGLGWTDTKIAEVVKLSEFTVRNHRRNIMSRLGIHSTPELIRYALEHGFTRARGLK